MEFSESLNFGNSTFMNLENLAKNAINEDESKPSEAIKNVGHGEVIGESPNSTRGSRTRLVGFVNSRITSNSSSCKYGNAKSEDENVNVKFRKTKSDSNLGSALSNHCSMNGQLECHSDFFRSEFSIEEQNEEEQKLLLKSRIDTSALIRVSQLEKAFENSYTGLEVDNSKKRSDLTKLDAALFSEDIQAELCDGNKQLKVVECTISKSELELNSQLFSHDVTSAQMTEEIEIPSKFSTDDHNIQMDESCFIACGNNEEEHTAIIEELERSKREVMRAMLEEPQLEHNSMKLLCKKETSSQSCPLPCRQSQECYKTSAGQAELLQSNCNSLKSLSNWQIPVGILQEYERKGIRDMFDWQIECLSNPKVLFDHKNLVYSAPTSAGKTLVSEILLIKTIVEREKKVILILPFISVVREKMLYLQDLLQPSGYRVEGFFGGYTPPGGFDSINVAICTIEKANAIVNKLLEQGKLSDIGTVIVDEVHLISDSGRGYILELLLAKMLYMSRKNSLCIQVVAMSATLSNVNLLQSWLQAELYVTTFRPVALEEMIKIGNKIFDKNMKLLRQLRTSEKYEVIENDGEHVAQLCIETLLEGYSAIIFCPSKDWCEKLATQLAGAIHALGKSGSELGLNLRAALNREDIGELKRRLKDMPTGLDAVLERTITFGCAFHHAGMTMEERDLIEAAFKSGSLRIIVATSTLSSGVNLPARRVLIRTPLFAGKAMSSLTYRQMIGRAGRTGKDTLGESILVCTESNARIGRELITASLNPITSCLEMESSTHLKRALLEIIASGAALTRYDILNFVHCTLLSAEKRACSSEDNFRKSENKIESIPEFIREALDFLIEYEFIRSQTNEECSEEHFIATRLGLACLASSMPPTDGLILFAELQKSRRCFVLESELHAVYLVTPYSVCSQLQDIDWLAYLDMWEKLKPSMKKVGELVGIKESFLVRAMRGQSKLDYKLMQIHKRFYTALALQELVNETPINQVAIKYKCNRGMLQSLQQMASTFAGIVTAFCNSLNWSTLALIVSQFKERLFFGIHRDLIDLMRLPDLNHKRARALYDAGITNLIDLANAESFSVEKILHNSLSFDTVKQHDNENIYETERRNNERNMFLTGKLELTVHEASKLLVQNARLFVQYEIGVGSIHWSQSHAIKETFENNVDDKEESLGCDETQNEKKSKTQLKIGNNQGSGLVLEKTDKTGDRRSNEFKCLKENENHAKHKTERMDKTNFTDKKANSNEKENYVKNQLTAFTDSKKVIIRAQLDKPQINVGSIQDKQIEDQLQSNKFTKTDTNTSTNKVHVKPNIHPALVVKCEEEDLCNDISFSALKPQTNTNKVSTPNLKIRDNLTKKPRNIELQNELTRVEKLRGKCVSNTAVPPTNALGKELSPEKKLQNIKDPRCTIMDKHCQAFSKTPKLSARSYIASSTRIVNQPEQSNSLARNDVDLELFMQEDETFEMNTGITKALKAVNKILKVATPGKKSSFANNGVEDEIPSSQKFEELEEQQVQTPQRSRFLRSYRNQRRESPKVKNTQTVQLADMPIVTTTSSSSIELSDLYTENSLMQNPQQLNASKVPNSATEDSGHFESVEIIDLCGSHTLFQSAFKELKTAKRIGVSIALQKDAKRKPLIGSNILSCPNPLKSQTESNVKFPLNDSSNTYLAGVAFTIHENIVYFLNMQDVETYEGLTKEIKCEYLSLLLKSSELTMLIHDAKEQLKAILKAIPSIKEIGVHLEDPKVANWLLQPDRNLSFSKMAEQFAPNCLKLLKLCGSDRDYGSIGLKADSTICPKVRSSVEACVTNHILNGQKESLEKLGSGQFIRFFKELEMPLQLYLCNMELYGFPASESALRQLFQKMIETIKKVEAKIYELHGSRFNLDSISAVARVLGLHRKSKGRVSTSRQILEKIDSPISQLIITYRKLSVTLKKNIQPLLKCVENNRIHGQSVTFTSTGRISMIEPNLQNVAKDFFIELGAMEKSTISCRSAFFAIDANRCLISSDFCQLEMRILAHLSQDVTLLQVINSDHDVFTALAARWNKIKESEVSEQLRNGTKQICYGIVYGMGMRSLAEALKCTEEEANSVSEQFHAAYPGIRVYTEKVVKFARHKGYIETITGRRRYLEHINSSEVQFRKQAERQAINSTIQGSAADIAKSAIIRMENNITKYREKLGIELTRSVKLVLHLHDELIYEVPEDKAKRVAKILRLTMENCVKLNVPLKVKIKIGKSWGSLKEVNL